MLKEPVKPAWQLTGSVVYYDPSGFMYNGRSHNWSECHHHIIAITSHSTQPLIALMHSDGNVWIGKTGDPADNLFQQIHSSKNEAEKATAIAFHPSGNLIAVAILAQIIVYEISPALKPELHLTLSFYELGYFCPKPKFSANTLDWNPAGTFLTAISAGNLSRCFSLKPDTNEVIGGFNGGMKYAELGSFQKGDIPPSCSCFSVDGGLVMTGYSDGTLMTRSAGETDKGLTLSCSKIMNQFLPGKVDQIVPHPHNSSVFAIEVAPPFSLKTNVLIALVNHDGSVTIFATIQDAKSPYFHKDWLLVSSGNKILFHHMNRCNIPCLVTEFHLQGNGTMRVEIDAFCVKTAPDGKIKLYYSLDGKLYTAEITLG
jgi:WD40 repeat protein